MTASFTPRLARAITLVVALAMVGGCGRFYRNDSTDEEAPAALVFTNQSLDAADVFAVPPGGAPVRLGSVMAGRTDTLVVPRQVVESGGNVNIIARLLARSYSPSTGSISIRPGDLLDVRLGLDARLLSVVPARQ